MLLLRFMVGNTGQKLRVRLSNMVYRGMLEATNTPNGKEYTGEYMRGVAKGILTTVRAIESHLPEKDFSESDGVNTDISQLPERVVR